MVVQAAEVENWLDQNWEWTQDYFLRRMDLVLINKWLMRHGFRPMQEYIVSRGIGVGSGVGGGGGSRAGRRESACLGQQEVHAATTSPDPRPADTPTFFVTEPENNAPPVSNQPSPPATRVPQRSNSKKYLRQDFARARLHGMFRTTEGAGNTGTKLEQRRNSLKGMRQFLSLPPTSGSILSMLIQSKVRLPRYASIDEELKRELRLANERDFILEIVKDISHDLDLRSLTGRILVNICILLQADRSSLFFVEGPKGRQQLVSKVFDVYAGTSTILTSNGDNVVRIPWGTGIIGHVADTGETVNITDANQDPRYNDAVDRTLAYNADSLLCMPVYNADKEIIGVAQVINKDDEAFSKDDEKLLEMYLTFCGMAISNAQAIESYTREYDRNKGLLEVVHDLFEEQTSVDNVVTKIMQRAQTLLKCERCLVMLKDQQDQTVDDQALLLSPPLARANQKPRSPSLTPKKEGFSRVFDLQQPRRNGHVRQGGSPQPVRSKPKEDVYRRRNTVGCLATNVASLAAARDSLPTTKRRDTIVHIPDSQSSVSGGSNMIAEIVASTGETINIADAHLDPRCNMIKDEKSGICPRSVLCKPIRNNKFEIIGVAQLINRTDGKPFDEQDDQLFEAFTIFCGLGINNCMLYDEVSRSAAKQAVALEVLSYHATITPDTVAKMKATPVPPSAQWLLHRLDFNDFSLDEDQMVLASIRMFKDTGLLKKFKIEYEVLIRWLLTVRKNYRNVAYHNWKHAFNVCQIMFALLTSYKMKQHLSDKEALSLLVACLCHDLDHRGTNNAFQHKSSSALAQLYGTQATLEHHHFNHAVIILNSEGHNIFANLNSEDYSEVMNLLKSAIIATDISRHFQTRAEFFPMIENGECDWTDEDKRAILRDIMMTTCDIGSITKRWEVQRRVADLVVSEFMEQGDKERQMFNTQPQALMDRERQHELPRLQMDWIQGVCLPLYKHLALMDSQFQVMVDHVLDNHAHWEALDMERQAGEKPAVQETDV